MKELSKLKKLFIFSSVHNWNDTRIFYKEAVSLAKKYEVELHAPADFSFREVKGIKIYGLPQWEKRLTRIKTVFILFYRALKSNADVFHFHDPELIFVGIWIKVVKRKKVIYDIHENIVKQIISKEYLSSISKILFSTLYYFIEKIVIPFVDVFIIAEDSYNYLYPSTKAIAVHNFPICINIENKTPKQNKIVYVGNWIQKERGVMELLQTIKILKNNGFNIELHIIGKIFRNSNLEDTLNNFIKENKLANQIIFYGWLDYYKLFSLIEGAIAGIVCLHPIKNFVNSYPTKIFEYMLCSVPVIASNFPLWRKIVETNDCGICVNPLKPKEMSHAIEFLINNPNVAQRMGRNGRKAVEKHYNWKIEEKKLFVLYQEILEES
ncbi:MAG: glycosyltransferase [Candidatus Cloacimonetes bacterium]|nr:glycosyltransferase [Candidatus Cloacimonadota bacterium]